MDAPISPLKELNSPSYIRNYLVITNQYPPPINSGRRIRHARRAKFAHKYNWKPVVLTYGQRRSLSLRQVNDNLIKVYGVSGCLNFLEKKFRSKRIDQNTNKIAPSNISNLTGKILEKSRHLFFPDFDSQYIIPLVVEGLKIIKKENVKVIYSACAPFTPHIVALLLKRFTHLPWLAAFEDPWVTNPNWFRGEANILHKIFERKVVESADRVLIYGNYSDPKYFFETYSDLPRRKFKVFKYVSGYDPEQLNDVKQKEFKKFAVTYAGSFYGGQCSPKNFLVALKILLDENRLQPSDIAVNFLGGWERRYAQIVNNLGLSQVVRGYPPISHEHCLSFLKGSDCLLIIWRNFGPDTPRSYKGIIHGKLGDYIGCRKPILALIPRDWRMARLIKSGKTGIVVNPDDPEQIAKAIESLYRGRYSFSPSNKLLRDFDTRKIVKRFFAMLDEVVGEE